MECSECDGDETLTLVHERALRVNAHAFRLTFANVTTIDATLIYIRPREHFHEDRQFP